MHAVTMHVTMTHLLAFELYSAFQGESAAARTSDTRRRLLQHRERAHNTSGILLCLF
jgi:hypothetical protein